jgi:hypothetical protein
MWTPRQGWPDDEGEIPDDRSWHGAGRTTRPSQHTAAKNPRKTLRVARLPLGIVIIGPFLVLNLHDGLGYP